MKRMIAITVFILASVGISGMNGDGGWGGGGSVTSQSISNAIANGGYLDAGDSGATHTFDFSGGKYIQKLTLTDDCTITMPTAVPGEYIIQLAQDSTGSRSPSFSGVDIYWSDSVPPVWTSTAGKGDTIHLYSLGGFYIELGRTLNHGVYNSLSDDYVAYWKLSDTSDESDNGYTLTNNNSVTFTAGKLGNAASFASASDQSLTIASPAAPLRLDTVGDWSIACWVYHDTVASDQTYVAVGSTTEATVEFRFDDSVLGGSEPDRINCILQATATPTYVNCFSSTVIAADTWYFAVATYDASETQVKLYVNASLEDTETSAIVPVAGSRVFGVGRREYSGTNRYMNGDIDNLLIFNKVLSQSEINELYNGSNGTENF